MVTDVRPSSSGNLVRYKHTKGVWPVRGKCEFEGCPLVEWIAVLNKDGLRELGLVGPLLRITANLDFRGFHGLRGAGDFNWPEDLGWTSVEIIGDVIGNRITLLEGGSASLSVKGCISAYTLICQDVGASEEIRVADLIRAKGISASSIMAGILLANELSALKSVMVVEELRIDRLIHAPEEMEVGPHAGVWLWRAGEHILLPAEVEMAAAGNQEEKQEERE